MKSRRITLILVVLSMVFAAVMPAMAQSPEPSATPQPTPVPPPLTATTPLYATANYTVNVRSGPGREYTVIGRARQNDALDITGKLIDGTWLRVNLNGQESWVLASLFTVTGDLTTAPEAVAGGSAVLTSTLNTAATAVPGQVVGTTTASLNLRSLPSVNGDVMVVIPYSTKLVATGRLSNNNWVQVTFENHTGWITSEFYAVSRGIVANLPAFGEDGQILPTAVVPVVKP